MAKTMRIRVGYAIVFLLLGLALLVGFCREIICDLVAFTQVHVRQIAWCAAWSLMGMGAGLINSRKRGSSKDRKYLGYFLLFVLPLATLAALLAGLLAPDKHAIFFYLASMLVAIGVGFSGDALAGKLYDMVKP